MKKMLFSAFSLLSAVLVLGQEVRLPFDSVTRKLIYTEEVSMPGKNAQEIYDQVKPVVFRGFDKVKYIRFWSDANTLTIFVNGGLQYYVYTGANTYDVRYVNFEWRTECRDGAYKYTITNFNDGIGQNEWTVPMELPYMNRKEIKKVRKTIRSMGWVDERIRTVIDQMKQRVQN